MGMSDITTTYITDLKEHCSQNKPPMRMSTVEISSLLKKRVEEAEKANLHLKIEEHLREIGNRIEVEAALKANLQDCEEVKLELEQEVAKQRELQKLAETNAMVLKKRGEDAEEKLYRAEQDCKNASEERDLALEKLDTALENCKNASEQRDLALEKLNIQLQNCETAKKKLEALKSEVKMLREQLMCSQSTCEKVTDELLRVEREVASKDSGLPLSKEQVECLERDIEEGHLREKDLNSTISNLKQSLNMVERKLNITRALNNRENTIIKRLHTRKLQALHDIKEAGQKSCKELQEWNNPPSSGVSSSKCGDEEKQVWSNGSSNNQFRNQRGGVKDRNKESY